MPDYEVDDTDLSAEAEEEGEEYPVVVDVLGSIAVFVAFTTDDDPDFEKFNRCLSAFYECAGMDEDRQSTRENIDHLKLCFELENRLMKYRQTTFTENLDALETLWDFVDRDLHETWKVVRDAARELDG